MVYKAGTDYPTYSILESAELFGMSLQKPSETPNVENNGTSEKINEINQINNNQRVRTCYLKIRYFKLYTDTLTISCDYRL